MKTEEVLAIYQEELAAQAARAEGARGRARSLAAEVVIDIVRAEGRVASAAGLAKAAKGDAQKLAAAVLEFAIGETERLRQKRAALLEAAAAPDPDGAVRSAWMGARTRIHEALQAGTALPARDPDDDDEDHHDRQKRHFKKLWKEADRIVLAAGITEDGKVTP